MDTSPELVYILLSGAVGAVIGALIPVVVQPYFAHRLKLYEQKVKHANRLIRLELELMDIDSGLHDNKIIIRKILTANRNRKMTMLTLIPLRIDDESFFEVLDKNLNSEIHKLRYNLKRLEQDVNSFNKIYRNIIESFLSRTHGTDFIQDQIESLSVDLPKLIKHIDRIQKMAQKMIYYVRARKEADVTWLMKWRGRTQRKWIEVISSDSLKKREDLYNQEIEENSRVE